MIEITDRWGLAKKGRWESKDSTIETPNIFFLEGKNFEEPDDAELTLAHHTSENSRESIFTISPSFFKEESEDASFPSAFGYPKELDSRLIESMGGQENIQIIYDQEPDPDVELYILANAPQLFKRSRDLFDRLISLREKIAYHKLIYVPGIANPRNIAFLSYLGADLFDSAFVDYISSFGQTLTNSLDFSGGSEEESVNKSKMNLKNELQLVRKSIEEGSIRELVESRVRTEPWLVECLRMTDKRYSLFSEDVPISNRNINVTTREGLNRPDVMRYIKRIDERYSPPERDVLLLLPCSASKPYFNSRSHRRFREATQKGNWTELHEVILTSPLGAVPREIEVFPPAQSYDVPVSHEWYEEEKDLITSQLETILEKGSYKTIIDHLPEDMGFVSERNNFEGGWIDTTKGDHPTDKSSLERLSEEVVEHTHGKGRPVSQFLEENLRSFSRFQFGENGDKLLENARVKGRYPRYRILEERDKKKQRGMLVPQRGLISLTLKGASILKDEIDYRAEIDDFRPKGSVFAVGVKDASEKIRPEDEVIVVHEGDLRGVGPASMSGREMVEAKKGEAVRIRHYE